MHKFIVPSQESFAGLQIVIYGVKGPLQMGNSGERLQICVYIHMNMNTFHEKP